MRILVTGGLGFIGSHLVRYLLNRDPAIEVVNVDSLTYAGSRDNVASVESSDRYHWEAVSVTDPQSLRKVFAAYSPLNAVVHLAAETHVDRSVQTGVPFVVTNVLGTQILLELAREFQAGRFLQVSTDEVYGSLGPTGYFTETSALSPNSPYSASKAAADLMVLAAYRTYGQDVVVTRCSNNYGPNQFPEKLIPLFITNGIDGQPWPLYGDGGQVRDWIHVSDHVEALWQVLARGQSGQVYNIGARNERTNREVAETLCRLMALPPSVLISVTDRPGHDRRYAIDPTKVEHELDWRPQRPWLQGLAETVAWYRANEKWWRPLKDREKAYYERQYGAAWAGADQDRP